MIRHAAWGLGWLVLSLNLASSPAFAQPVPGTDSDVGRVRRALTRETGKITLPARTVRLNEATGNPTGQVEEDSTSNGVGYGMAAGAGVGLAILGIAYARCDDGCEAPSAGPLIALAAGVGAGGGAGVGWLIDKARHNNRGPSAISPTVSSVAATPGVMPIATRHQCGVVLWVRF